MDEIKKEIEELQIKIFEKEKENKKLTDMDEVRKYIEKKCLIDYFKLKKIDFNNVFNSKIYELVLEMDTLSSLKNVKKYLYNKELLVLYNSVLKILIRQYKIIDCSHVWYVMGENKQDKICRCLICNKEEKQNKVLYNGQIEGKTFDETKQEYSNYLSKYHSFKKEFRNDDIVKKLIMKKRI